jgi:hypothetical protein
MGRHCAGNVSRISANRPTGAKYHLDQSDEKYSGQRNSSGHRWIIACPELGETWITQGYKRSGKQVDECGRNQHTSSEMPDYEKKRGRYMEAWESDCEQWESACGEGDEENDHDRSGMERNVVFLSSGPGTASASRRTLRQGSNGDQRFSDMVRERTVRVGHAAGLRPEIQ